MGRRLLLANLVLLAGTVLLAQQLVESWREFQGVPAITPPAGRALDLPTPPVEPRPAALPEFLLISERNLFTPGRGSESADDEAEAQEAPEFPVDPKLISVSSFGGVQEAVLEVFEGRRGRQSDRRVVRLGDDVNGYQVAEIEPNRLTLAWQDVRLVLELEPYRGQSQPKTRAAGSVNIITVGSAVAAVETTSPEAEETEARGVEVGVVSAQQGRGALQGRGSGAAGLRGGRGQQPGRAGVGTAGRRGFGQTNPRTQGRPGTVGFGGQQPPPTQNPPPR